MRLLLLTLLLCIAAASDARNVVLIVTDDQGQDAGCYGNPVIKTPHLDALAADATLFRNAHRSELELWAKGLPAAAAVQYFDVVRQTQSRAQQMPSVSLPGSHRYHEALDRAVHRATVEGQDPETSLRQAADDWRKITAELGIASQRAALARSLGQQAD